MKHLKVSILLLTFMGLAIQCTEESGGKDKIEEISQERESENYPHILTLEEIKSIQEELNTETEILEPVKLTSWKEFKGVQFPDEGTLTWSTSRVLEIQTAGDIIFPEEFYIQYNGMGGGLILKSYFNKSGGECVKGTIKFENVSNPQIDFSQSTNGAISLIYEPTIPNNRSYNNNYWHKYHNPTDFSKNIKLRESNTYFCSFMLVDNSNDLQGITYNPAGNYALSQAFTVDRGNTFSYYSGKKSLLSSVFNGNLNYNGFYLTGKGWNWDQTLEEHIFEKTNLKDHVWGKQVTFIAPPLYGVYKKLLELILLGDEEAAVSLIGLDYKKLARVKLVYIINGTDLQTPLHLAAKFGLNKIVEAICNNVTQNITVNVTEGLGISAFSFIDRFDAHGNTALDLAARYGHFETVSYLIELHNKHRKSYYPQPAIQSIEDQRQKTQENYEMIRAALESLKEEPENFPSNSPQWTAFPDKHQGYKKEYKRMQLVHDRFFLGHLLDCSNNGYSYSDSDIYGCYGFRPLRTNLSQIIFSNFCKNYLSRNQSILKIDNLPSRSRILLFCNITALKLSKLTSSWGESPLTTKTFLEQSHGQEYGNYIQIYNTNNGFWKIIPEESKDGEGGKKFTHNSKCDQLSTTYRYGGKEHTVTNKSSKDKPGFSILSTIKRYESNENKTNENENIRLKVQKISERMSSSSKVAEALRQSRASGRPITAQQLLRAGHQGRKEVVQEDAEFLNCLTLLLDLEVSSRLIRENKQILSVFDELPIGIAWGRTQSLIINNHQSYRNWECFSKNSPCHLFSGEPVNVRKNAIQTVNQNFLNNNDIDDGRGERSIVEWKQRHPYGAIIASRETLHQELLEEYGGGYESDGDVYESSDEEATL